MIASGLVFDFALLFLVLISVLLSVYIGHNETFSPEIKSLPALEAIDEGINRSTEMGKPVHFTAGRGDITTSSRAPGVMAGFNILSHVAERCAERDVPLWVSYGKPEVYTLIYDVMNNAYIKMRAEESFDPDRISFFYKDAYAAGVAGLLQEKQFGLNMMLGAFGSEALICAETGFHTGAMQISGANTLYQIPFFIATSDYVLIGEELFVAGAKIAGDPRALVSIYSTDLIKLAMLGILVLGSILSTFGIEVITNMLRM